MKAVQMQMDFGELAYGRFDKGNHAFVAKWLSESPAGEIRLMESICERENMRKALHRVEQNRGAPGVDGMKTTQLRGYRNLLHVMAIQRCFRSELERVVSSSLGVRSAACCSCV